MEKTGESSRVFGRPILKTGKPTVYPHSDLKTHKEIRGSGDTQIRTLRADEYEALRQGCETDRGRIQLDALLLTGMRYVEVQRLHDNPKWFDGNFVFLPRDAVLKQRRKQKERYVRLTLLGRQTLPLFFQVRNLPGPDTWKENLQRWATRVGLDPVGLGPKTTRKTWESWLVTTFKHQSTEIVLSQGHDSATSLEHYLNMPFLDVDRERIKPWVDGFF